MSTFDEGMAMARYARAADLRNGRPLSAANDGAVSVLQHVKAYGCSDGGIERAVKELVTGLRTRERVSCDVICQGGAAPSCCDSKVLRAETTLTISSAGLSWEDFRMWRRRRQDYDIVHVHLPWPQSNFNALLAPVRGKVVVHWHSDIVRDRWLYTVFKPFESWLLRRADKICVTSEKLLSESAVLGPYKSKCVVIPIGIRDQPADVTAEDAATVNSVRKGRKLIFGLGRLVLYKGFYFLVEAARQLSDDYVVVIGGRGPMGDALGAQIKKAGLEDRVKLVGYLTDGQVQAYMQAAECLCLPSVHNAEAFGIVQIEAMRARKPVISTELKGSGVSWVNQHGQTGLVVPPCNASALADAIKSMCSDDIACRRFGESGRARYEALFTADKMVEATEKMYGSLLKRSFKPVVTVLQRSSGS